MTISLIYSYIATTLTLSRNQLFSESVLNPNHYSQDLTLISIEQPNHYSQGLSQCGSFLCRELLCV